MIKFIQLITTLWNEKVHMLNKQWFYYHGALISENGKRREHFLYGNPIGYCLTFTHIQHIYTLQSNSFGERIRIKS